MLNPNNGMRMEEGMTVKELGSQMRKAVVVTVGVLSTLTFLTACSGNDSDSDKGGKSGGDRTTEAAADPSVPSGDNKDLENPQGARADLTDFKCDKSASGWTARGTLKNPESKEATYLVSVSVYSKKKGTVAHAKEDKIVVKGDAKRELVYENFYDGQQKGLACSVRVVKSS